ncbi:hypothetical protein FOZ61_008496 [Perkinsus olseni]|uniref:Uncharacterized protein n=1 Tax=Perkinsus olseni TaxID=32597 RepID=A0A7J6L383_PEROL|nr:hypothetical protein FOZ61_008496 [Perkinsus olseni]
MSADIVVVIVIFLTALGALHLLYKAAVMTFRTALDRLEKRLAKVQQEAKACSATAEGRQEKVVAQINERIEAVSSQLATLESQQSVVLRALTQVQQDHKAFQNDKAQIMIDLVEQRRTLQQYVTRMKEARKLKRKDAAPVDTEERRGGKADRSNDRCKCLQMASLGQLCPYCKSLESDSSKPGNRVKQDPTGPPRRIPPPKPQQYV